MTLLSVIIPVIVSLYAVAGMLDYICMLSHETGKYNNLGYVVGGVFWTVFWAPLMTVSWIGSLAVALHTRWKNRKEDA